MIMEDFYREYYPDIPIDYKHELKFPYVIHSDAEYIKAIHGQFFCYIPRLECILDKQKRRYPKEMNDGFINEIRRSTNLTAKKILLAYDLYFAGHLEEAIEQIASLLDTFKSTYVVPLGKSYGIKCQDIYFHPEIKDEDVYFVRGREIPVSSFEINKANLYHIPFNKRELIKGERFSVYGIPCLYLANCTYVAEKELKSENKLDTFYATFKPTKDFLDKKIIDLSMPDLITDVSNGYVPVIGGRHNLTIEEKCQFLRDSPSYLLNIACRIQCDEENRNFKSEYVIPQLVMYCLDRLGCVGVVYESSCCKEFDMLQTCFAFPAFKKEKDDSLYSDNLINSFEISSGFNYSQFVSKRHSTSILKGDNPFTKDYAVCNKGYFGHLYQGQDLACYDRNTPYYKTDKYAFDQF